MLSIRMALWTSTLSLTSFSLIAAEYPPLSIEARNSERAAASRLAREKAERESGLVEKTIQIYRLLSLRQQELSAQIAKLPAALKISDQEHGEIENLISPILYFLDPNTRLPTRVSSFADPEIAICLYKQMGVTKVRVQPIHDNLRKFMVNPDLDPSKRYTISNTDLSFYYLRREQLSTVEGATRLYRNEIQHRMKLSGPDSPEVEIVYTLGDELRALSMELESFDSYFRNHPKIAQRVNVPSTKDLRDKISALLKDL